MSTKIYTFCVIFAAILASSSALEAKEECAPLELSEMMKEAKEEFALLDQL